MTIEINFDLDLVTSTSGLTGSLSGDTMILDEHGELVNLEEIACEYDKPSLTVLTINERGRVKKTIASQFRINDWANEVIKITLDNGHVIYATKNQKFQNASGEWIKAENLSFQTVIATAIYNPAQPHPIQSFQEVTHIHKNKLDSRIPFYTFTVKDGNNLLIAQEITGTKIISLVPVYAE